MFLIIIPFLTVVLYLSLTYRFNPIDPKTSRILNGASLVALTVWLLLLGGVFDPLFGTRS